MNDADAMFGTTYRFVWCLFPRTVRTFNGAHWQPSGRARGTLVKVSNSFSTFYTLPETLLRFKCEPPQRQGIGAAPPGAKTEVLE